MGRTLTNATSLSVAIESTFKTQPTTGWKTVEWNTMDKFGPDLKKVAREPVSKSRQRRKGALVDLDSAVSFETDITYDNVRLFIEQLMFANAKGGTVFTCVGVTSTGYTVASGGALAANTLIYVRGSTKSANNGLKVVGSSSTGTEIKVSGLTAETVAATDGMTVEICGVKLATADGTIVSGNVVTSTFNWATGSDITVGQFIFIGDGVGATNSFATAADNGLARVMAKSATTLTLDKKSAAYVDDAGTGKAIYVYWGRFVRNVAVDATDYIERSVHFEFGYENAQDPGPGDLYEYAQGNYLDSCQFDIGLTTIGKMKLHFIGTNTPKPTSTRATGADTPIPPVATGAYNTTADMLRLRVTGIDETGLTTDFKNFSVTIKNNVSPEKVIGILGAKYMNAGMFDVEIDATALFTSAAVIDAMRDNTTVTAEACMRNDDGAFIIDLPSMTIEGGDKQFPINQSVTIGLKSAGFQHPVLGTSASISTFPYMPST